MSHLAQALLEECRTDLLQCRQNLADFHEKTLIDAMYDRNEAHDVSTCICMLGDRVVWGSDGVQIISKRCPYLGNDIKWIITLYCMQFLPTPVCHFLASIVCYPSSPLFVKY